MDQISILFAVKVFLFLYKFPGNAECHPFKQSQVLFGTKTAYKDARNIPWPSKPMTFEKRLSEQRCKPSQLNIIHRHGSRYPGKKDVKSFKNLEENINKMMKKSTGISPSVKVKFPWKNPFGLFEEKDLSPAGDDELFNIGRRFASRFPEILAKPFAPKRFKFHSTCKERCSQSAAAFALGYLKGKGHLTKLRLQPVAIINRDCDRDFVLRFYDNCPKYQKEVEKNESILIEMKKFANGKEVFEVIEKVKRQLGLSNVAEIDHDMVFAMYKACAFSIAIHDKTINYGWCSLFDENSFNVMEYLMDLKTYYESGPFYPITSSISCLLIKDIITSLNDSESVGIFRSAHSSTLFPLLTEMNFISKGTPLKADNYDNMGNRIFRSGAIVPFAGNIAFVKYDCKSNVSYIRAFINEKLAPIKCCKDPGLCTWYEFESCYNKIIKSCDFNKMCKV